MNCILVGSHCFLIVAEDLMKTYFNIRLIANETFVQTPQGAH